MTISRLNQALLLAILLLINSGSFASAVEQTTREMYKQAVVLIKNQHIMDARKRLQIIVTRPDATCEMFCELAETYLNIEGTDDTSPGGLAAMRGLNTALQKDPNCSKAYRCLAEYANFKGRYAEGERYSSRALACTAPDDAALRQRALAYSHLNRIPEAIKDEQAYIAAGHQTSINYMLLADLQKAIKRFSDAESNYRMAMTKSNAYYQRSFNELIKLLSSEGKNEEVIAEVTQRMKRDPSDAELYDVRGQTLVKLKKYSAALTDFNAAIKESNHSLYFDHRAACYDALGQKALATADREQSKKLSGNEFPGF